jgi:outer membrane lipoprotein SlyB
MNTRVLSYLLVVLGVLSGCASTGAGSSSAKPVFYPNTKLDAVGQDRANQDAEACISQARTAGLSPEEKDNAVAHGAEKGAAVGGVAAAVGALVRGKGVDGVIERGAQGAAIGGSAGAVAGAFRDKPSTTYRHYVQRCLKDKGYEVIGWN